MKVAACAAAGLLALALAPGSGRAEDVSVPLTTTRDLIALCTAGKDDPNAIAKLNLCHGFAEGAVAVELERDQASRGARLFCLPSPPPARSAALAEFVTWAKAVPGRVETRPAGGLLGYLVDRYPCAKPVKK